jgi:DNA-binding response OmpR family regulator
VQTEKLIFIAVNRSGDGRSIQVAQNGARKNSGVDVTTYRILHVDGDTLMREMVELALDLEPAFALMSAADGQEALAMAPDWAPNLILCDLVMPDMDGTAVLAQLRKNQATARMPFIFMTARAEPDEVARLKSLGALAVIAKPFNPATLAATLRGHLRDARLAAAGYNFGERLRSDTLALTAFRATLHGRQDTSPMPEGLQSCAHKLAGAAGVFGLKNVSRSASALEESIIAQSAGSGTPGKVESSLDALLACIERK